MAPLTIDELWGRSLELFLRACKLFFQAFFCLARIGAIHVRFVATRFADGVLAASEWIDKWEPVRISQQ